MGKLININNHAKKRGINNGQKAMIYPVVAAIVIFYSVFIFFPMIYALIGSFFNWNIARGTFDFNGIDNYKIIFNAPKFRAGIVNSVIFSVITTFLRCFIGIVIAVMIFFSKEKLKGFYRMTFFLPIIVSMVAASYIWKWFFDGKNGIINFLLNIIGITGPDWLSDGKFALPAIIIMTTWKDIGFAIVLYLAGLAQVSPAIYEAAKIDGASKPKIFYHMMLPLLGAVSTFLFITSIIGYIQAFDQFYIMTKGGPGTASYIMGLYLYEVAFKNYNFGQASSISFVMFVIILILTLINMKIKNKSTEGAI